jgi:ssDNA-binding Zn-finger/Zn-ribbon topoisomerase 1
VIDDTFGKRAHPVPCPECGGTLFLQNNAKYGPFYCCENFKSARRCTVSVGCHPGGEPMGYPANEKLKKARIKAHESFDKLPGSPTRWA